MAAQQENALAEGSSRRVILAIVLAVFVIFEISIILIFRTGEEIHWKKELTRIEAIYNRGEYKSAAERMTQFGKDWPGAVQTFDWNKKMGLYHAKAEDWATAAAHYARAAQIDAKAGEVRALAGEAYWKAGDRERADKFLTEEIGKISRAIGDHDRAHFYLGLAAKDKKDYLSAFAHFQAIADRDAWKSELESIYTAVRAELVEPARARAAQLSPADIPTPGT